MTGFAEDVDWSDNRHIRARTDSFLGASSEHHPVQGGTLRGDPAGPRPPPRE